MKARILIVEDESIIALDLSGISRDPGYEPSVAASTGRIRGEQALGESLERVKAVILAAPTGIGATRDRILLDVDSQICPVTDYAGQSARIPCP